MCIRDSLRDGWTHEAFRSGDYGYGDEVGGGILLSAELEGNRGRGYKGFEDGSFGGGHDGLQRGELEGGNKGAREGKTGSLEMDRDRVEVTDIKTRKMKKQSLL